MKLTDIKKLKVTELRSRLKELGLESSGLKAELVERLWSATEMGHCGRDGEKENVKLHDGSPVPPVRTEPADVHPPSTETGVTGRHEVDRAYTDMATQTETEPCPTALSGSEAAAVVTAFPADVREQGHAESLGEEDMVRGRAFYEFKEEIRYKR